MEARAIYISAVSDSTSSPGPSQYSSYRFDQAIQSIYMREGALLSMWIILNELLPDSILMAFYSHPKVICIRRGCA